jgi:Protein of unknown function (DUF3306)
MANDDAPSGFLSRWSRRKVEVREGRAPEEPKPITPVVAPVASGTANLSVPTQPAAQVASHEAKPAPTLADTQQLTPESDFTDFMARGVAPDVKNAAVKKLFADPHFNVMDRLDIYIDDYSQPDPLPMAMLRQMASAKTLGLFDDEPEADSQAAAPIDASVNARASTVSDASPASDPLEDKSRG